MQILFFSKAYVHFWFEDFFRVVNNERTTSKPKENAVKMMLFVLLVVYPDSTELLT